MNLSPVAKLGVGLTQTWMMFELAMRIRQGTMLDRDPSTDLSSSNKALRRGQRAMVIFIITVFLGFVAYAVYICVNPEKFDRGDLFSEALGYSFLIIFVLMAAVNSCLIVHIKAKNSALEQEANVFDQE